jgi:hypothetical protein
MPGITNAPAGLLLCGLILFLQPPAAVQSGRSAQAARPDTTRDGQRDFDFEIGSWRTRLSRLERPLSGSASWVHYEGTTVVRKVWNGGANLVELDVAGPAGRIEGLSLRLYNPLTRQWSLHFANRRAGTLAVPVIGGFSEGRGEFYAQESLNGRSILSRFVITIVSPDSCRFEQAFSADGGRTWETNWIATDTRIAATSD